MRRQRMPTESSSAGTGPPPTPYSSPIGPNSGQSQAQLPTGVIWISSSATCSGSSCHLWFPWRFWELCERYPIPLGQWLTQLLQVFTGKCFIELQPTATPPHGPPHSIPQNISKGTMALKLRMLKKWMVEQIFIFKGNVSAVLWHCYFLTVFWMKVSIVDII